ncbi:hypothetical protein GCM10011579_034150 [Streptomyces albiflavescens]|uniref:Uncharacterized protein n=1 Tax=Streptomyces albiflavescens TaxID=1623582 RepID=A0A918D491_9ACTN|nr:hypothetical protein GCM10011579_034150 [Streptomyces albiflavescens]
MGMGIVGQLVPDELWELFQRVAPVAPTPQGPRSREELNGSRHIKGVLPASGSNHGNLRRTPAPQQGRTCPSCRSTHGAACVSDIVSAPAVDPPTCQIHNAY